MCAEGDQESPGVSGRECQEAALVCGEEQWAREERRKPQAGETARAKGASRVWTLSLNEGRVAAAGDEGGYLQDAGGQRGTRSRRMLFSSA